MAKSYGELLCAARRAHDPPMTAKELADLLDVKPPFITDIEKGRRLPSLDTQKKIKKHPEGISFGVLFYSSVNVCVSSRSSCTAP